MKIKSIIQTFLGFTSLATAHAGQAFSPAPVISPAAETSDWEFTGAIYTPLMGLEGDIGVRGLITTVDLSFGDILKQLDGGMTAAFEARHDRWSITGDFIWLKLSASGLPTANSYLGFKQEEIIGALTLGYEIYRNEHTSFSLLGGAAFTSLDADLELFTPRLPVDLRGASGSEKWVDPFIGIRLHHQLSDRWSIWLRGDYGGFGISADEYSQAIAGVSFRLTECTSVALAYRLISVDYQDGGFTYDTEMAGPNLGLVIRF